MGCDEIASRMEVAPSEGKSKRVRDRRIRFYCYHSTQVKIEGVDHLKVSNTAVMKRERLLEEAYEYESRLRRSLFKTTKPLPIDHVEGEPSEAEVKRRRCINTLRHLRGETLVNIRNVNPVGIKAEIEEGSSVPKRLENLNLDEDSLANCTTTQVKGKSILGESSEEGVVENINL